MQWLVHWLIVAGSILITAKIVPGIRANGWGAALFAAVILGVLNIFLKPLLIILTLPLTIVTFGFFLFVVNALVLKLTGALVPGFSVRGFWASVFGAFVITLFSWIGDEVATRLFEGHAPHYHRLDGSRREEAAHKAAVPPTPKLHYV